MTNEEFAAEALRRGGTVGKSAAELALEQPTCIQTANDNPIHFFGPNMSEDDFKDEVIKYAKERGWKVYHTYRSDRSEKGFPDLVMVRGQGMNGVVVYAELKTETGKPTKDQQEWLNALEWAGEAVYLWRPSDWPTIKGVLK
jgi:DNA repair exonuclease SbcCD nuclease subunit